MNTEQIEINQEQQSIIAANLAHLMRRKRTTETKVAQDLNIPVMTVRRLLSGETTDPRVFTLKTIADYFNVTVDNLIDIDEAITYEFINRSKPLFIPVLDWEIAKDVSKIDLKKWHEWIPVTVGKSENISSSAFALESRPSMYPRFQQGTIFILDPDLNTMDWDLVLINLRKNNELTLRELFVDPPEWQLHPVHQGSPILKFSKENHEVIGVVFMTLFYNRKMRPIQIEA